MGSSSPALGQEVLGFVVMLLACVGAGVALAVPSRWHLMRLRFRAQAVRASARTQTERVARSAAAGAHAVTTGAKVQSERAAKSAAAHAPTVKDQLAQIPRRIAQPLERSPVELLSISNRARKNGRNQRAATTATKAADGFRREHDAHGEALALNALALAQASDGRYTEAVAALDRALGLLAETDKRHDEGRILANLGVVHRKAGGAEAAKECRAGARAARLRLTRVGAGRRAPARHGLGHHRGHCLLGPLGHVFRRDVLDVRRHLPLVAEGIGDAREPVAPEHVLRGAHFGPAGVDRLLEDLVDVVDVEEDAGRRRADRRRRLDRRLRERVRRP